MSAGLFRSVTLVGLALPLAETAGARCGTGVTATSASLLEEEEANEESEAGLEEFIPLVLDEEKLPMLKAPVFPLFAAFVPCPTVCTGFTLESINMPPGPACRSRQSSFPVIGSL